MQPADRIAPLAATPSLLRRLNERSVLDRIRAGAPISRADVAREAGLSKPTVSLALQSLVAAGLVREVGVASGGPGRSAVLYEPDQGAARALGIEVGADRVRAAVTDLGGGFLARAQAPLPPGGARTLLDAVVGLARSLADEHERSRLHAIVLGLPGVVDPASGRIEHSDIPGLSGLALVDALQHALGVAVTAENDVNLAALGERFAGVSKEVSDFAYLAVGPGIAAGLVLHGELHRGRRGAAGALASLPLGSGTLPDAERIALCIASIAAVVDVEQVVLGGELVVASGETLLMPVRERVARLVPRPPLVELTALGGDATLAGALAVGASRALDRVVATRTISARSAV